MSGGSRPTATRVAAPGEVDEPGAAGVVAVADADGRSGRVVGEDPDDLPDAVHAGDADLVAGLVAVVLGGVAGVDGGGRGPCRGGGDLVPGVIGGGAFGFAINSNEGFVGYVQTVAGFKNVARALVIGNVVFCSARFENTQLVVGVNGPPSDAIATPGPNNIDAPYRTLKLFTNYNATAFLDCTTLGMGFSFSQFADADFSGIRNWLITEFDL